MSSCHESHEWWSPGFRITSPNEETGGNPASWTYGYDPIGNRETYEDETSATLTYTRNPLNQYTLIDVDTPPAVQGLFYDEDGNLQEMYVGGDIDGDGDVDQGDLGEFLAAMADPIGYQQQYPDRFIRADLNADGTVDQADLGIFLAIIGMPENNAVWAKFTWDAENRLIGFEPQEPTEGSLKIEFKYDHMGRRVEKAVYAWDDVLEEWGTPPTLHRRFVWYNWLLLEELDVDASGAVTGVAKKYTWGLDLAGQWGGQTSSLSSLEGAGGIGGLLALHDPEDDPTPDKNYVFFYDANGNVGQLIDWENDGTLVAKYEYDPYGGNLLDPTDPQESGPYGADNPWRFSTKYLDAETALGYWGYRYYSPRLGRWLNRDPLGEGGGRNIYTSVSNRPTGRIDPLGQQDTQPASQPAACCGLSVNHAVLSVLVRIDEYFDRIPKKEECNGELMRVCKGILQTDVGWDIRELAEVGAAQKYKESPLITRKCGTGACAGTVQWGKTCYRANEMNYILWGALNRICNERKFEWMMLGEADEHGRRRYKDCDGNEVSTVVHTWSWTAAVVYSYRSAFNLGLVDYIPAAPAGQGSIRCRVAWARRGYHLGGVPEECEVKECGYCSETYDGDLTVRVAGDPVP